MSYASALAAELFSTRVTQKFSFSPSWTALLLLLLSWAALPGLSTAVDNFVCNYFVISYQSFKALV